MSPLTIVVITQNEEANIERCLRSLTFADEVILVDAMSEDATIEKGSPFVTRVLQHAFDGDIPQRQRGFAGARNEWLMYVDADEEISQALRGEIEAIIANPATSYDGFEIPRRVKAFGRWISHGGWYPDYSLRLFRRGAFRVAPAEVHGGFVVDRKGRLSGELFHYTYPSIEEYLRKMNDYTSLAVSSRMDPVWPTRRLIRKMLLSPGAHFFRKYIMQQGYRDGFAGFCLAMLGGIYTLSLYAKIWEFQYRRTEQGSDLPPIRNVELQSYKRRYV